MALIKCAECENEISDQAKSCLRCGHPTIPENKIDGKELICPACGKTVIPVKKFDTVTFIILLLLCGIPGLFYAIFVGSGMKCPSCMKDWTFTADELKNAKPKLKTEAAPLKRTSKQETILAVCCVVAFIIIMFIYAYNKSN